MDSVGTNGFPAENRNDTNSSYYMLLSLTQHAESSKRMNGNNEFVLIRAKGAKRARGGNQKIMKSNIFHSIKLEINKIVFAYIYPCLMLRQVMVLEELRS